MLDCADEARGLVAGRERSDLDSDRTLELALVRLLEIVGEAAAHVSQATRAKLPAIPWASIVGLRNRLIHGYDAVDLDVLWEIARHDLPPLIRELREGIEKA
jgi:uncharacterized protein with HEPN domain